MARKDILPSYLGQQAWQDLFDAVDAIFATNVDIPANNLGLLRSIHAISPNNTVIPTAITGGVLFDSNDMDYFETEVLVKQLNMLGLVINLPQYFASQQLVLMLRTIAQYWYSKGTSNVANYLTYLLGMPISMTRMWTADYVTFLTEGDPGIGATVYQGGTWYPTTTVQVVITGFSLPGGMPLEIFGQFFEEFINYTVVPQYVLNIPALFATTTTGPFIPLEFDDYEIDYHFIANFNLSSGDQNSANGGGGYEAITTIGIPGAGGTGYTLPAAPTANFTASVTSGVHPLTVTFTNLSSGYIPYAAWDFNGMNFVNFIGFTPPSWIYTTAGTYHAKLTVMNSVGLVSHTVTITVT